MPQEPDDTGRIIVSKKVPLTEWKRTIENCKKLPGKVKLDEYVERALRMLNDHHENVSPDIESHGINKMKLVAEGLEKALKDFEDLKLDNERKERRYQSLLREYNIIKKVEEKVT